MTLEEKARHMRSALDEIELALMGFENLVDLPGLFEHAHPTTRLSVPCTVRAMRQVCDALAECTRIVNSPEYHIEPMKTAEHTK